MRVVVLLVFASAVSAGDVIVRRDKGKRTGKQSVSVAGHGIAYRASPARPFLRSVLVHGARYGNDYEPARTFFDVAVRDGKGRALARTRASYGLFRQHLFTWVEVPLPEPIRVPAAFQIVVDYHATATRGVYVGYADVTTSHSSYVPREGRARPFARGKEWMIRARLSATATPLARGRPDVAKALKNATVEDLRAPDLVRALAHLGARAGVAVVLDAPGAVAVPVVEGRVTVEEALATLTRSCGLAADVRWGVVFVTTPARLARLPAAVLAPPGPGPERPSAAALRAHLFRRRVDLDCVDLPLEAAVAQIANWLEFEVRWDPAVDRTQRVTLVADSLVARDALAVVLVPRACAGRVGDGFLEVYRRGD